MNVDHNECYSNEKQCLGENGHVKYINVNGI